MACRVPGGGVRITVSSCLFSTTFCRRSLCTKRTRSSNCAKQMQEVFFRGGHVCLLSPFLSKDFGRNSRTRLSVGRAFRAADICGFIYAVNDPLRRSSGLTHVFAPLGYRQSIAETGPRVLAALATLPGDMTGRQWVVRAGLDPRAYESGGAVVGINLRRHAFQIASGFCFTDWLLGSVTAGQRGSN